MTTERQKQYSGIQKHLGEIYIDYLQNLDRSSLDFAEYWSDSTLNYTISHSHQRHIEFCYELLLYSFTVFSRFGPMLLLCVHKLDKLIRRAESFFATMESYFPHLDGK